VIGSTSTDTWAWGWDALVAIGTLAAAAVALALGLGVVDWLRRPRISLHSDDSHIADRVVTGAAAGNPVAYLRARVRNDGRAAARNVQVVVLSVETWMDNTGRWVPQRPELWGRALAWSNNPVVTVDVPPRTARLLDVVCIPRDLAAQGMIPLFLTIQPPLPANDAQELTSGGWRFSLEVSGDNVRATRYEMQIRFDGAWPGHFPEDVWRAVGVRGPARRINEQPPPRPRLQGPVQQLEEALDE